jgi:hypothetical protein
VEKAADIDLVREMLAFAADRMMDAEVETETGAAKGARTPLRENQRNGYRERDWDTQRWSPKSGHGATLDPRVKKDGSSGRETSIGRETETVQR